MEGSSKRDEPQASSSTTASASASASASGSNTTADRVNFAVTTPAASTSDDLPSYNTVQSSKFGPASTRPRRSYAAAATDKEEGDIEMLDALMGGGIDRAHALRLLRSYNGDVEKTATALLEEGATAATEGAVTFMPNLGPEDMAISRSRSPPG